MSAASNRMWHRHRSLGSRSHKTIRHMKNSEESLISQSYMPGTPGTPSPRQPLRHWKATHGPHPRVKPEVPQNLPYPSHPWPKRALGFCKDTQQCSCGNESPQGKFTERKLNCLFKEKIPKGSDRPTPKTTQHGTSPQLQLTKQCRRK